MMSAAPEIEPTMTGQAPGKTASSDLVPMAPTVKRHLSPTPRSTAAIFAPKSRGQLEALREQLAQGDLSIDDAARLTREYIDNI